MVPVVVTTGMSMPPGGSDNSRRAPRRRNLQTGRILSLFRLTQLALCPSR
jgi:hypothetical protein